MVPPSQYEANRALEQELLDIVAARSGKDFAASAVTESPKARCWRGHGEGAAVRCLCAAPVPLPFAAARGPGLLPVALLLRAAQAAAGCRAASSACNPR